MTIIYFVRHAERDISIRVDKEAPLTLKGHQDAQALKYFFKNKNIHHLYSSPYIRAMDTIQPTAAFLNQPIKIINDFYERKIGAWIDDFSEFAELQWQNFDYKRENGESLNEVSKRMIQAFENIIEDLSGNTIMCGHGTALAVLFYHLSEKTFGYDDWLDMRMPEIYSYNLHNKKLKKLTIKD